MTTAIERFSNGTKQIFTNTAVFYGVYVSGCYNRFFSEEAEAQAYCADPVNDYEFNSQTLESRYTRFDIGEAFYLQGEENVYLTKDESRYIDPIAGKWQMPFVSWQATE